MKQDLNNPWHKVPIGEDVPNIVNGIIEIPMNTRAKYELDKDTGLLKMDRVIYSSMYYPANYGFIPRTYCDDKDPPGYCYPVTNCGGSIVYSVSKGDWSNEDVGQW